tara:strand:- start:933 stop:1682 length:750 start_codon:yes stop_codon:yes gene_type:complete
VRVSKTETKIKEKEMKKITKSIAAIAVIFGSLVYCGNAAFAISKIDIPDDEKILLAEKEDAELAGPGSFDISLTPDLDTHCDEDDGVSYLSIWNNLSDLGIIPPTRWVAVHLDMSSESYGDASGWLSFGLAPYPLFHELEKGEGDVMDFPAPEGSYELTVSVWISGRELDQSIDVDGIDGPDESAEFIATNEAAFQKTVSVVCSSDDPVETTEDTPVETTEDTPVETTEDTPEDSEVDDPIEGSPLFTG